MWTVFYVNLKFIQFKRIEGYVTQFENSHELQRAIELQRWEGRQNRFKIQDSRNELL